MPKLIGVRFCDSDFISPFCWALKQFTVDSEVFLISSLENITKEQFCFYLQELIITGYYLNCRHMNNKYTVCSNTEEYIREEISPKNVYFDNEVEKCYQKWGSEYLRILDNTGYKPYTYYME